MTRRYGRAQRGQRITEGTPGGRWQTLTMLGAISSEGWIATMTVSAPTDSEVFLTYLQEVLCPALRPGQVVVMDNLAAHKVAGVAEAIGAARSLSALDEAIPIALAHVSNQTIANCFRHCGYALR